MKELETEQRLIRAFLLGEFDEQERERLEERLLTDPEFKETVLLVEDELIEDYLADRLPLDEREKFSSKYLLAQPQRRKLQMLSALRDLAIKEASAASLPLGSWQKLLGWLRKGNRLIEVAAVGVLMLVVIAATWLLLQNRAVRNRREALTAELARLNGQGPYSAPQNESVVYALLMPVTTRDAGAINNLTIPADAKIVQLQLPLSSDQYRSYRATLRTVKGGDLFSIGGLQSKETAGGKQLSLRVPSSVFEPDDYHLEISGLTDTGAFETVGAYYFHVSR